MSIKMNIKEFLGLEYYVSGVDKFLAEFDKSHHKLSPSQQREVKKHKDIFKRSHTSLNETQKCLAL
jgi:hypothetical protein